jgi:hypothetical protein
MIVIKFSDPQIEKKAIGFLARRFPLKTSATGETVVPEAALAALANEGISFTVQGRAAYGQRIPAIRNPDSAAV